MKESQTRVVRRVAISVVGFGLLGTVGYGRELPHYRFVLPDGYVGWIQVIFSSPNVPEPPLVNKGLVLRIDDSGVFRTSMYGTMFTGSHDEFLYSRKGVNGKETLTPVPTNFVCTEFSGIDSCYDADGDLSDGFTVGRANLGHANDGTPGNSWFLFVGPLDLRKKHAKPVHRAPGARYKIDVPEDDPKPGRIQP